MKKPAVTTRAAERAAAAAAAAAAADRTTAPPAKKKSRTSVSTSSATVPRYPKVDEAKLPVRTSVKERLVRTAPCTWGASPQATPLVAARLKELGLVDDDDDDDPDSWRCKTRPDRNSLNLRTRDPFGAEIFFKCKPTTLLQKLFTAYCVRSNHAAADVGFTVSGSPVSGDATPEQLGLEDGDTIHVHYLNAF